MNVRNLDHYNPLTEMLDRSGPLAYNFQRTTISMALPRRDLASVKSRNATAGANPRLRRSCGLRGDAAI